MARGGGLNLVGAVCSQAALFGIMAVLANALGSGDVGRYAECYALLSLLGLLSLAGFRSALTRFVAIHLADEDPASLRGTVRFGLGLTVAGAAVLGAGLALTAPWVASLFHDPGLAAGIRLVGLTLPAATFSDAALAATQGWRTQRPFTYVGRIYEPVIRLLLTVGAIAVGLGLLGTLWALVIGAWSAAGLAGWALLRRMRQTAHANPVYRIREVTSFSIVSWVSALAATGLIWADTLLLGNLRTAQEVGVYNVATRLVMLAVFVMAPINAAFGPHIAHLHHTGQADALAHTYGSATGWIVRLSMPAFVLLVVFPGDLLRLFGHGFATGATVTAILAVGQLVSAAAGPCGTVLTMSGRVWLNMVDNVGVLVLNILLNLWLIPTHGAIGAAVAWSVSLVLANATKLLQVRYVLGVSPAGSGTAKAFAAAMPALLVALVVHRYLPGWAFSTVVGIVAVALTYLASVALLGLSTDDRTILRAVSGRHGARATGTATPGA
ncbi:MAG TPA: flippase [Oryzihumus sp.]